MPDAFGVAQIIKQFIPPHKQIELQDRIVDTMAKAFPNERWRSLVSAYRSDAAFQDSLSIALRRAVQRFVADYSDKELVIALTRDTHFWDVPSVQHALQELVTRPSTFLDQEWETVLTSFSQVLPAQSPERVEASVRFFLRCLTKEVITIPQLAPIYQVQFQWASLEHAYQLIELQRDQKQLMTTLVEAVVESQPLLLSPPKPVLPKVHDNLPPQYGEFVGRERDIKRVLDALQSRWPLVSIEGLGGMGKTTLAIQSASYSLAGPLVVLDPPFEYVVWVSAKDRPEQKQWLNEVLDTIARLLGYLSIAKLPLKQIEQKKGEVYQLLHSYRTLLIIDNFETIKDFALEAWIQDIPAPSKVLITSRTGQLRSSRPITLKGLKEPEALELIRNQARSLGLQAIMVAGEEELLPFAQVSGGNPKVIGMALGYIKRGRLSLSEVIEHLQIASQTVNGIFDDLFARIWNVMSRDAQDIIRNIPLFADFASKEALGAVAKLSGYFLDNAVEEVVELKLLDIKEDDVTLNQHYSAHPLTRAFASAKLLGAGSFEEQAVERWKKYYLDLAARHLKREVPKERYWNALAPSGFGPIDQEWPNLRKLLAWVDKKREDETLVELMLLLTHYMDRRILFSERLYYARKAVERAIQLGRMEEAAVFCIDALGWTLIEEGLLADAEREITKGLHIAQRISSPSSDIEDLITLAHTFLARVRLEQGKVSEASAMIDALVDTTCKPVIRIRIDMAAGDIAYKQNDKAKALQFYKHAQEVSLQYRGEGEDSEIYNRLGAAYLLDIDEDALRESEKAFMSTLNTAHFITTIETTYAKYGLARLAKARGDKDNARRLAHETLDDLGRAVPSHRLISEIHVFLESLEAE